MKFDDSKAMRELKERFKRFGAIAFGLGVCFQLIITYPLQIFGTALAVAGFFGLGKLIRAIYYRSTKL